MWGWSKELFHREIVYSDFADNYSLVLLLVVRGLEDAILLRWIRWPKSSGVVGEHPETHLLSGQCQDLRHRKRTDDDGSGGWCGVWRGWCYGVEKTYTYMLCL